MQRTTTRTRGRAIGPGLVLCVGALAAALVLAGCGTATTYPSFLPKKTLTPHVDEVMVGSMAKPALQIEGLPVAVDTKAFHVRVTVSGRRFAVSAGRHDVYLDCHDEGRQR
jgi:hypothetical protein